jgi:ribosomal subunit interface protein
MILQVNYKGIQPSPQMEKFFQTKTKKLARFTNTFPDDAVLLRATLNYHPRKAIYSASLHLSFPQKTLTAKESGPELMPAVRAAIEDLFKQLEKFKSRLNREHLRRHTRPT